MKFLRFVAGLLSSLVIASGAAHALPIVGGITVVKLTSAPVLGGADVSVGVLGSALVSPGSDGLPLAFFPVTGGAIDTGTFAGSIEHAGSGLSLTKDGTTIELTNFVIDTVSLLLSGDVAFGATTLDDVGLFDIGLSGNAAYPFSLSLTSAAAGALTAVLGLPDLTGLEAGIANSIPITAVPEASSWLMMGLGLSLLLLFGWKRRQASSRIAAPPPATV
jgi:hypothetical protein